MNKIQLIEKLRRKSDISKPEARIIVESFFNSMATVLSRGDRVEIRGLCSFYVKKYKPYSGRNPKTGKKVRVKAKKLPFFKCGTELKERVDLEG